MKDLNQSQREALREYRESKELTEEEQEFIQKNYPTCVTTDDIIFTEEVCNYILQCSNNEIDTPTSLVSTLQVLIGKIQNGEFVGIPANTPVETAEDSYCWVDGNEFDMRHLKDIIKEL